MKATWKLSLLTVVLINSPSAKAESLSQLEFDKPKGFYQAEIKEPSANVLREILGAETTKQEEKSARARLDTEVKKNALPAITKEDLNIEWPKPADSNAAMLIPALKGPRTNANDNRAITSEAAWSKKGYRTCGEVKDAKALCSKTKALGELLNRYSGSDEFFESQCSMSCSNPEEKAVLSGFAVSTVRDGEYKILENGDECRYEIRLNSEKPVWQVLRGERGICSCLPKNCL